MISLLFYIALAAASAAITHYAQKLDKKILLVIPIVLLSLVAGFRSSEVGADTYSYIYIFNRAYASGVSFISRDRLFYQIGIWLMKIWNTPQVPLFAAAFFTYLLMFLRMWDFRYSAELGITAWVYILYYWGGTMNGVRQMLAVAIVFYASRSLLKRKYFIYLIGVAFATLIHFSAIVSFVIPLFYIGIKKTYGLPEFLYLGACLLAAVPVGYVFIIKYAGYLDFDGMDFGLIALVRFTVAIMSYILFSRSMVSPECPADANADSTSFRKVFAVSFVGFILAFASVFIDFASRAGYYFRIFEIVFWGMIFRQSNADKTLKVLVFLAVSVLGAYYLWRYSDIIPYRTIFG